MSDPRLFLWPRMPKGHPKVEGIKEVVLSLDLGYSVKPFYYDPERSVDVKRVLLMQDGFEYGTIVDTIRPLKRAQLDEAVRWALGLKESRGARTALDKMKSIFGEGLTMREEDDGPSGIGWEDA